MYLLELDYNNAKRNGSGRLSFRCDHRAIRKWTVLDDGARSVELARLVAVACLGRSFLPLAREYLPALCRSGGSRDSGAGGLSLEFLILRHPPRDCASGHQTHVGSCVKLLPGGDVEVLEKRNRRFLEQDVPMCNPSLSSGIRRYFALAYGPSWNSTSEDCFDFADPHRLRFRRFQSVFDPGARLTDASAFLQRLHYRMIKGRQPAILMMNRLAELFERHLALATESWLTRQADFSEMWRQMPPRKARILLPIIDAMRHIVDATPHDLDPLARTGVIVFVYPQRACPPSDLAAWFTVMDLLLPSFQFVVVMPAGSGGLLPGWVAKKVLTAPIAAKARRGRTEPGKRQQARIPKDAVLLIDVDGRMPNLALMKLGGWLRRQGWQVMLVRRDDWRIDLVDRVDKVYASCVFNLPSSQRRLGKLRKRFRDKITIGGSGVDIKLRLPVEIEATPADYSLYPELDDRAIGFLTRGCPRRCAFCIVPEKEGAPRQVSDLDELLQDRSKLVLLDDNLLAHPRADAILEELAEREIRVNFNQTLDLSFIDRGRADLLRQIDCANYRFSRPNYHFSLNNVNRLDMVRRNYEYFGFHCRENVEFICMYGYDTTLAEDVERFRFLRSLPGAYVFVQEYKPVLGRATPRPDNFFDSRTDQLIDDLIKVLFPQNMKSMEKYYRWLSRRYLDAFGKLYAPLVDTIFRYNYRDQKGLYVAKMLAARSTGLSRRPAE